MSIWALSDLHLAFGNTSKNMEVFGPSWQNYAHRIKEGWLSHIKEGDLVLIPGDISWAMKPEDALIDLEWIHNLPGTKLILRGNHDYWWPTAKKLKELLPPSIHFIQNNSFEWNGVSFGGARLWDTNEYTFSKYIEFVENPRAKKISDDEWEKQKEENERIFERELGRLRLSLEQMNPQADLKIALTHYPPISADLNPSRASAILEEFGIQICVFGHLHNVRPHSLPFGTARGVKYLFTSVDYIDFTPIKVTL